MSEIGFGYRHFSIRQSQTKTWPLLGRRRTPNCTSIFEFQQESIIAPLVSRPILQHITKTLNFNLVLRVLDGAIQNLSIARTYCTRTLPIRMVATCRVPSHSRGKRFLTTPWKSGHSRNQSCDSRRKPWLFDDTDRFKFSVLFIRHSQRQFASNNFLISRNS